ncbi:MAG: elongation factor P [Phycisphaerae bacterium]|nr:elongation factor P [Phycisphaerae bacterium]
MAVKISDLRRGQGVYWNDEIWIIWKSEHVTKGKGGSCYHMELRNAKTQQIIGNRFRPDDQLEPVMFDRKKYEYLYSDANSHVLMDPETYDQLELPLELVGDGAVYLTPNCEIEVCSVEGEFMSAELPNTVELKVEDVPPQVKGATATNQLKDAVCEGGARVKVPPFVENGCMIKVDTRNGEYLGRV